MGVVFGLSFNGRTQDFGSCYRGSNPCSPAKIFLNNVENSSFDKARKKYEKETAKPCEKAQYEKLKEKIHIMKIIAMEILNKIVMEGKETSKQ